MLTTIILVILVLALLGALPVWNHSRDWNYGPSGLITVVLVVLLIFWLIPRL